MEQSIKKQQKKKDFSKRLQTPRVQARKIGS